MLAIHQLIGLMGTENHWNIKQNGGLNNLNLSGDLATAVIT